MHDELTRRETLEVIGGTGIGVIGLSVAGVASTTVGAASSGAPAVEWRRSYEGGEREYQNQLLQVLQSSDGGYALLGEGAPITKTGPEERQVSVLQTNSDGKMQWISFAGDERADTQISAQDFFQTADGAYVGLANVEIAGVPDEDEREGLPSAAVAKFGDTGDVEWVETVNKGRWRPARSRQLLVLLPSGSDGGAVAFGTWEGDSAAHAGWVVQFAADGTVEWDRTYSSWDVFRYAFPRDGGGYTVIPESFSEDLSEAIHLDEDGDVQGTMDIDLDFGPDHYVRDILPTTDGGFALGGEVRGENWDMWLAKLDESGDARWSQTYDGPYEGSDGATRLLQTADGGFALGGFMSAAYTGERKAAIVKTAADGTEEWRKLLDSSGGGSFIQTDDGGYAMIQAGTTLVKLGPGTGGSDGGTDTPAETGTPTETPTRTETPTGGLDVSIETEPPNASESDLAGGTDVTLRAVVPESAGMVESIEWDANGGGGFERTGETITISLDFCGAFPIAVRVTTADGRSATASVTLSTV